MINFLTLISLIVTNKDIAFVIITFVLGFFLTRDLRASTNATLKIALALFIMKVYLGANM